MPHETQICCSQNIQLPNGAAWPEVEVTVLIEITQETRDGCQMAPLILSTLITNLSKLQCQQQNEPPNSPSKLEVNGRRGDYKYKEWVEGSFGVRDRAEDLAVGVVTVAHRSGKLNLWNSLQDN